MDNKSLQVGWFDSAKYDDQTPVAAVAAVHEFGSKHAPPRPIFRQAIEEDKGSWSDVVESGAKSLVNGGASVDDVMNGLGLSVQASIKNAIASGTHVALAPSTLAARRSRGNTNEDTLRDSGRMLSTVTYEVGE